MENKRELPTIEKRENQRVEHWNLVYTQTVYVLPNLTYVRFNGALHKVYPTGIDNEPWTTNLNRSI